MPALTILKPLRCNRVSSVNEQPLRMGHPLSFRHRNLWERFVQYSQRVQGARKRAQCSFDRERVCSLAHHEQQIVSEILQIGAPIEEECFSYHAAESEILSEDKSPLPGTFNDPLDGFLHASSAERGISKSLSQKRPQLVKVR